MGILDLFSPLLRKKREGPFEFIDDGKSVNETTTIIHHRLKNKGDIHRVDYVSIMTESATISFIHC